MPRQPRLYAPNAFYHVTLRGNHGQRIFFSETDRSLMSDLVAKATLKQGGKVHAYCWMTNHVHLLLQIGDVPLGGIVRRFASRYARGVQARLATKGHLFERRYHAVLVDADSYLLELLRYIHLNPVRAGLCRTAGEHRWSSHAAYLGGLRDEWVTTGFALAMFHAEENPARRAYAAFVAAGEVRGEAFEPPAPNEREPRILGNDDFAARVAASQWRPRSRLTLADIIDQTCRTMAVDAGLLVSPGRDRNLARVRAIIARRAVEERIATLATVARAFSRDESSLRAGVARLEQLNRADAPIAGPVGVPGE